MKKVLSIALAAAFLGSFASPVLAGGDKVRGAKGTGTVNRGVQTKAPDKAKAPWRLERAGN